MIPWMAIVVLHDYYNHVSCGMINKDLKKKTFEDVQQCALCVV